MKTGRVWGANPADTIGAGRGPSAYPLTLMDQSITISVPARTGYVHVLRAVTAGVAASLDLPIDEIDDLRLAVDEASAHLISGPARAQRITVRLTPREDRLEVLAWGDTADGAWSPEEAKRSMSWHVLSALADEASLDQVDGAPAIRFSKRLRAGSA
jgi:serine/threonine-protein kinase RsbW